MAPTVALCLLAAVAMAVALWLHARLRGQAAAFVQTRRQLEESRERLQLALDGADEALWDWNVQERRTYYSDRWSRMLGYSPEEIGESVEVFDRLVHPEDLAASVRKLEAHMRGETGTYQAEFRMRTRDGAWRWIQARGKVVARDAAGAPVRVAGTHLDVTSQKECAAALAQARDAALAASRSKSAFLANMSHEIRTPMNGIIAIAELLLETVPGEPQRGYAEIVRNSGEALLALLNDILDFSKIEAGELHIESTPFDLPQAVRQTVDLFALAAERKNIPIAVEIAPETPSWVAGDPWRLRQVLMNLVGNALKFTGRGGIAVRCRPVPDDSGRIGVEFEVSDTGVGMDPATIGSLFRPFTQADDSTTRRYGGTGLGLAISKQLVELMHGRIEASSVPGQGSTFRFTAGLDRPASSAVAETDPGDAAPREAVLPARILLAEDNAINQKVLSHLLAHLGHSVEIVSSGREAVEAAGAGRYDAILMDCQMPEMSGYEATRLIREQDASGRRLPIIALTANAMSTDRDRCLAAGMDDYLSKPVKIDTLSRVLERWLAEP